MLKALWLVAVIAAWIGVGYWMLYRKHKRLGASRPAMADPELIRALTRAGADEDVARSVIDWITLYYGRTTAPHANDRMKADISIDPDDIKDFVETFFLDNEIPQPTREQPEVLPDYDESTLTSLAVYLTERRATSPGSGRIET